MKSIRSRAPPPSSDVVRKVMVSVRKKDTEPELILRRALHASRLRYRKGIQPDVEVRGSADVVFTRARIAVFVDGCYWHGCPIHFRPPKSNREWWMEKIADNVRRDKRVTAELSARGWTVFRFWEHELMTREDVATAVDKIRFAIQSLEPKRA